MVDDGTLAEISSAIVGFGIVAFVFRVQRELEARERGDFGGEGIAKVASWLPLADRLLIGSVTTAILLVLFPIALAGSASSLWGERLPAAACSGSVIAVAGYIPAILARYRHLDPRDRDIPDPAERAIVIVSVVLGVAAAVGSFFLTS